MSIRIFLIKPIDSYSDTVIDCIEYCLLEGQKGSLLTNGKFSQFRGILRPIVSMKNLLLLISDVILSKLDISTRP